MLVSTCMLTFGRVNDLIQCTVIASMVRYTMYNVQCTMYNVHNGETEYTIQNINQTVSITVNSETFT